MAKYTNSQYAYVLFDNMYPKTVTVVSEPYASDNFHDTRIIDDALVVSPKHYAQALAIVEIYDSVRTSPLMKALA